MLYDVLVTLGITAGMSLLVLPIPAFWLRPRKQK